MLELMNESEPRQPRSILPPHLATSTNNSPKKSEKAILESNQWKTWFRGLHLLSIPFTKVSYASLTTFQQQQ